MIIMAGVVEVATVAGEACRPEEQTSTAMNKCRARLPHQLWNRSILIIITTWTPRLPRRLLIRVATHPNLLTPTHHLTGDQRMLTWDLPIRLTRIIMLKIIVIIMPRIITHISRHTLLTTWNGGGGGGGMSAHHPHGRNMNNGNHRSSSIDAPISDNNVSSTCILGGPLVHWSGLETESRRSQSRENPRHRMPWWWVPLLHLRWGLRPAVAVVSVGGSGGGGGRGAHSSSMMHHSQHLHSSSAVSSPHHPNSVFEAKMMMPHPASSTKVKGANNFKNKLKSGFKTATNWIPNVFRNNNQANIKTSFELLPTASNGVNGPNGHQQHQQNTNAKGKQRGNHHHPGLVRQGSTASSINSFYSSLIGSEEASSSSHAARETSSCSTSDSHAITSSGSISSSQAAPNFYVPQQPCQPSGHQHNQVRPSIGTNGTGNQSLSRCSSYDPIMINAANADSRRSSISGSFKKTSGGSGCQGKSRHLSQNLVVQSMSVGMSSEGYGSSLSSLNSTTSAYNNGADQQSVCPDTPHTESGSNGSNSTTLTVATQVHNPPPPTPSETEVAMNEECDVEPNGLILPDDMVRYLNENAQVSTQNHNQAQPWLNHQQQLGPQTQQQVPPGQTAPPASRQSAQPPPPSYPGTPTISSNLMVVPRASNYPTSYPNASPYPGNFHPPNFGYPGYGTPQTPVRSQPSQQIPHQNFPQTPNGHHQQPHPPPPAYYQNQGAYCHPSNYGQNQMPNGPHPQMSPYHGHPPPPHYPNQSNQVPYSQPNFYYHQQPHHNNSTSQFGWSQSIPSRRKMTAI